MDWINANDSVIWLNSTKSISLSFRPYTKAKEKAFRVMMLFTSVAFSLTDCFTQFASMSEAFTHSIIESQVKLSFSDSLHWQKPSITFLRILKFSIPIIFSIRFMAIRFMEIWFSISPFVNLFLWIWPGAFCLGLFYFYHSLISKFWCNFRVNFKLKKRFKSKWHEIGMLTRLHTTYCCYNRCHI
jgi:hypothetical protein